jgi:hypothetical protein
VTIYDKKKLNNINRFKDEFTNILQIEKPNRSNSLNLRLQLVMKKKSTTLRGLEMNSPTSIDGKVKYVNSLNLTLQPVIENNSTTLIGLGINTP